MKLSLFKSVPIPSYALPRKRRKRGRPYSGAGYEDGSTVLFSTTARFCNIETKTKLLIFDFWFDCYNKLNDPIVESLVRDGSRIFNEFIAGVKSYMEVSNETSDIENAMQISEHSMHGIYV